MPLATSLSLRPAAPQTLWPIIMCLTLTSPEAPAHASALDKDTPLSACMQCLNCQGISVRAMPGCHTSDTVALLQRVCTSHTCAPGRDTTVCRFHQQPLTHCAPSVNQVPAFRYTSKPLHNSCRATKTQTHHHQQALRAIQASCG